MEWIGDWFFGGRDGCLAAFYTPTLQDTLRQERRRLLRSERELERQLTVAAGKLKSTRDDVTKHAAAGSWERARRAAIELHQARLAFDRLGTQKDNIVRVADKLKQQLSAVTVDQSLVTLTRVMAARLLVMNPEQFARRLQRYEELKLRQDMTEDQLNEFFSAGDEEEQERLEQQNEDGGRTDDQRVALIYAELGIIPVTPSTPPPAASKKPGGGNNGGGSGGGRKERIATEKELLVLPSAAEHDIEGDVEHALQSRFDALRGSEHHR